MTLSENSVSRLVMRGKQYARLHALVRYILKSNNLSDDNGAAQLLNTGMERVQAEDGTTLWVADDKDTVERFRGSGLNSLSCCVREALGLRLSLGPSFGSAGPVISAGGAEGFQQVLEGLNDCKDAITELRLQQSIEARGMKDRIDGISDQCDAVEGQCTEIHMQVSDNAQTIAEIRGEQRREAR